MQSKNKQSIKSRLLWTALPIMVFFLLLTGFALDRAYQHFALDAQSQKLQLQLWSLMADAEIIDQQLVMPDVLQESLFGQPESGLQGYIFKQDQVKAASSLWQSISVDAVKKDEKLDTKLAQVMQFIEKPNSHEQFRYQRLPSGEFLVFQSVNYFNEQDQSFPLTFVVLESGVKFKQSLFQYREVMVIWLLVTLTALLVLQGLLLLWGLSPLNKISQDVALIESGKIDSLNENYPAEVASLAQNLNALIDSERNQRQRFRNTLSDLAHSLKTPLAVIHSKLEENQLVDKASLSQQLGVMDAIIKYQLNRSVSSEKKVAPDKAIYLEHLFQRLVSALQQVYKDKSIRVISAIDPKVALFIDEGDLMEVFGNILDNAFKYTQSTVKISVAMALQHSENLAEKNNVVKVLVEDDGAGISTQDRNRVLQRGSRLDQQYEGQGIGLTVAAEIIDAYGGQLLIEQSSMQGTAVSISFNFFER